MRLALVVTPGQDGQAVADTLREALGTRERIVAETPIEEVSIVFADDGRAGDRQAIADDSEFSDVAIVPVEGRRGLGAAVKAGWRATDADLVGFIDADGAYDRAFCVELVSALVEHDADVVWAARQGPDQRPPRTRRVGAWLFNRLLGVKRTDRVSDPASQFRVVKRSCLRLLAPLPNGPRFTLAMTCAGLLEPHLTLHEVQGMAGRAAQSRGALRRIADAVHVIDTPLFSICCHAPIKTMFGAAGVVGFFVLLLLAGLWSVGVGKTMLGVIGLAGMGATLLLAFAGVVVHQLNRLLLGPRPDLGGGERLLQTLLDYRRFMLGGLLLAVLGLGALVAQALIAPAWMLKQLPLPTAMMLLVMVGSGIAITGLILRVIWAVDQRQRAMLGLPDEQKVEPPDADASRDEA